MSEAPELDAKGRPVEESAASADGVFDFQRIRPDSFARNYLRTYYSHGLTPDEELIAEMLIEYFPKAAGAALLELGSGPTLHHVIPAAEHFGEIHVADYLPENLAEIALWKESSPAAHDWSTHTAFVLTREGQFATPDAVQAREALLRAKLTRLLHCDLLRDASPDRQYPAVASFYCTEEIGIAKPAWRHVVGRVADRVSPGGYLFLSTLRGSDYYAVLTADGRTRHLPCANITETDVAELLPALGFPVSDAFIRGVAQKGQEAEGIFGVVLVAARKSGSGISVA